MTAPGVDAAVLSATPVPVPPLALVLSLVVVAVLSWPTRVGRPGRPRPRGVTVGRGGRVPSRSANRAAAATEERLADLLGLVAAPLRAGVPATTSLAAAAAAVAGDPVLGPLVDDLVTAGTHGELVSRTWLEHAQRLDSDALHFVGRAWALSERTGAPLADALRASEEVLRARMRSRERLASAAAGPRASMGVLALLPLSGPLVGLACGIGPRDLYLSTSWSTLSLVTGLGFAGFGWWWSRSILERAT